jgi:hypothetical protein
LFKQLAVGVDAWRCSYFSQLHFQLGSERGNGRGGRYTNSASAAGE